MSFGLHMWAYGVLAVVLLWAAIADVRTGKIPNMLTYTAIVTGIVGHTLAGGLWTHGPTELGLAGSLAGLAAGFLPMLAAFLAGGVGGGDAKLMAAVGALAGWRFALATLFGGFAFAVIMAIVVMIRLKIVRQTFSRVGRFLFLLISPSVPADPAGEESPKIALGLALCVGAAVALTDRLTNGAIFSSLWGA